MLYFIGVITVLYGIYRLIQEIRIMSKGFPDLKQLYGKDAWAVVTGATDGIGKGFCDVLSSFDINICMIVRNQQKAEALITELSKTSKSKFKIIIADFTQSNQIGFFDKIHAQLDQLDIGYLINNVGLSFTGALTTIDDQKLRDQIIVNCFPVVFLTKKILPQLITRKRSAVINVSSLTGRFPVGFKQAYSGTKAFVDYFSQSLAQEVSNVDIMSLRPCYVTTNRTGNKKGNNSISPFDCAYGALQRLPYESVSYGHIQHRIQGLIFEFMPLWFQKKLSRSVLKKRNQI